MRVHKLTLSMSAGLATLLGTLAVTASPAGAAIGYLNLCPSLGTTFCTAGATETQDMAADNSSGASAGDVWAGTLLVHSRPAEDLMRFDASGNLLAEVGPESLPNSAVPIFANPLGGGIAVDPASGSVYVSASGVVTKFDAAGVFQFQITETPGGPLHPSGIAVGPAGEVYVADIESQAIDKFTSAGVFIESFPSPARRVTLASGPEGNLYVAFPANRSIGGVEGIYEGVVAEYTSSGAPVDCLGGGNTLTVESKGEGYHSTEGMAIAVDPSNGHLFVGETDATHGDFVAEYSSLCEPPTAKFGEGEISTIGGIAVSESTHEVFVDDLNFAFIYTQVTIPDATTDATPTNVTTKTAVVSGTVNPDSTEVTTCEFEYGTTPAYGRSVPCSQTLPLEGNSPIAVSAEIKSPFPPASQVHYRLRVGNPNGSNVGEDHSFYFESLPPPVVGGLPASGVSQFAATLNGTLQTGEALVNYRFEYGTTTAYGSVEPIPDGVTPIATATVPVSQPIHNLKAGTTYHYRLVASSPGATEVKGPDETFTTLPVPAPSVATGGASGVGVGLATVGGTVDPHGWDTSYSFQYGTSTAYGASWPTVLVDMGALEGPQPVVVSIPNLLPNTTYHYRLVANNGGGTSYGADMTFTTGEYPAQVIQEPVSLQTLLVPTGGQTAKPTGKKTKKARKKAKKHPKGKRRARRKKKH